MLRTILMLLGLLVSFLPYLGFPYEWNRFVWTIAGLLIFFLVFFSRRGGVVPSSVKEMLHMQSGTRSLHVERREVEDRPEVHVEREVVAETIPQGIVAATEQKTTQKRKHRKNFVSELHGEKEHDEAHISSL